MNATAFFAKAGVFGTQGPAAPATSSFNPLTYILPFVTSAKINGPLLDYAWIAVMWSILHVTRYGAPKHRMRGFETCLSIHIASTAFEVIRFHALSLSVVPVANLTATIASLFTSFTGLYMARHLDSGRPRLTRPCYQVGAITRLFLMPYAYFASCPATYHLNIVPAQAFIIARLAAPFLEPVMKSSGDAYAIAVLLATVISLIDVGQGTAPAKGLLVTIILLAYLNDWTSAKIESGKTKGLLGLFCTALFCIGLTNVETVKGYRVNPRTWQVEPFVPSTTTATVAKAASGSSPP